MPWLSNSFPFIETLQKLTFLIGLAKTFSFLGNENFFLILLPLIYWCIDRKQGAMLGVLLLLSVAINDIFKVAFQLPRPFWSGQVLGLVNENSFGFPSGHAQNAVLLWTFLASRTRRPSLWVPLALLLAFFIALSRIQLGVHFPADVVGGSIIGFVLLILATKLEPPASNAWRQSSLAAIVALSALLAAALFAFYFIALSHPLFPRFESGTSGYMDASEYARSGKDISEHTGALLGLIIGLALATKSVAFEIAAPLGRKVIRFIAGFVGILIFWRGLAVVFPHQMTFDFIRYALTTFWVTYGALRLFGVMEGKKNMI